MTALAHLRTLLVLGRVSNLPTIWSNVLVGWFLCGGGWTTEAASVVVGMSLLYIGGMTLNDAFDAEWDQEHAPNRPIPAGKIAPAGVWAMGFVQLALGVVFLLLHTSAHSILIVALVGCIFLYNWLHKKWAGSVLIMGMCRALVYLGAGSAVASHTSAIEVTPVLIAIAVGSILYIAGLTLAARSEHLRPDQPTGFLPRILLMLPVLFPLITSRMMPDDTVRISLIVVGVFGIWSWLVITRTALRRKIPVGVAYAIAGIAFYDAAAVAFADWRAAVLCLGCFVITLAAQRVIPAT